MKEKKWRVLIVDDEFRIAKLIEKLIRWSELDLELVGSADNGEAAFQIVKMERPDIVITDIRMPKMSGLDLICRSRELNKDTRFVVISGYTDFEYAHRALQYGVDDYLLKPVNEKELNDVMRKICMELDTKETQSREQMELRETVSRSRSIIKREFLRNIIEQEEETTRLRNDLSLEGEVYRGIDIKLDYEDYNKRDKKQDELTVAKVISIVEEILKTDAEEILICEKENLHIYSLFNYDSSKAKSIKNGISQILSDINSYIMGFEQYEVTIGIGSERTEFGEIRFSIEEANRAIGNRIKLGTNRLIYADSISLVELSENRELRDEWKDAVRSSIESYQREGLDQSIDSLCGEYLMQEEVDSSVCYELAEKLVEFFFTHLNFSSDELRSAKRNIKSNCQHCNTISGMRTLLKDSLGQCLDASRAATEAESTKPIRQAQQYINEHYGEKIVLEDIAEIAELNPVYFSVLFKKETGINFSTYLSNVRMEKAKELICSSNKTIAAIAKQVGYKDSRYFSQTFYKTVGVKPALYRKLHS